MSEEVMYTEPLSHRSGSDDNAAEFEHDHDASSSDSDKVTTKGRRFLRPHTGKHGASKGRRPVLTSVTGIYSSHAYFNYLWAEAMLDIRDLLAEEKERGIVSGSDLRKMFQTIVDVYYRYLKIYKTIDLIYDQMNHPQKRIVVKKILDVLISHLLELRWQLLLCDKSEISYFDEFAMIEGVFPIEIDMSIPKYYFHDPTPAQITRDKWFWNVVERERIKTEKEEEMARKLAAQLALMGEGEEEMELEDEEDGNDEDITTPLQIMERARQGKCRAMIAKYIFKEEQQQRRERKKKQRLKLLKQRGKKVRKIRLGMDPNVAAAHIQKLVRGFLARVRVKRIRNSEMEFLGIRSQQLTKDSPFAAVRQKSRAEWEELEAKQERRRTQRKLQQRQFEDAQIHLYNRLLQIEGPEMAERFKLQIRTWMLEVKERTGKFPDIPKREEGGTLLMLSPETLADETQEGGEVLDPEAEAKMKKDKQKAKDKEKKLNAKAKKAKKGGPNITEDPSLVPLKSFDELKEANFEYNRFWRGSDAKKNPEQKYEEKHIIREKRQLVEAEIRDQVDTALKSEIEYLKQVVEKRKSKKPKKSKGKKGKSKGKKGKKKKSKDLTPDRTLESLFEELVHNNIIRHYPKVRMDQLISQSSFINGELRTYHAEHPFENKSEERYMPGDVNPHPSFGDVVRAIKDVCILPMGSVDIHRVAPFLTKSVLIVGPPGSGKKTLVNMVCTELNATMIDLTAANIVGKYPGKPGLKMLMHLIQKVGKVVEPVIFLIDNCERTYMKKVPKTSHDESKRLKKQLGKFLKTFTQEDLFLLIGLSSEPWIAPFKALKKDYQRIFYIPPADYGTRLLMWKEGLATISEILHPDINYTLLAKLSQGWASGAIHKTCRDVVEGHHQDLVERKKETSKDTDPWRHLGRAAPVRFMKIGKVYITMSKLMQYISEYDPVFIEQEKLWTSWWNKTPLQKARLATQVKAGPEKKKGKKKKK